MRVYGAQLLELQRSFRCSKTPLYSKHLLLVEISPKNINESSNNPEFRAVSAGIRKQNVGWDLQQGYSNFSVPSPSIPCLSLALHPPPPPPLLPLSLHPLPPSPSSSHLHHPVWIPIFLPSLSLFSILSPLLPLLPHPLSPTSHPLLPSHKGIIVLFKTLFFHVHKYYIYINTRPVPSFTPEPDRVLSPSQQNLTLILHLPICPSLLSLHHLPSLLSLPPSSSLFFFRR